MSSFLSKAPRGIFILNHHGFGNVVLSLPLLQAISRWALNKCIVRVLFRSPEYFQLIQHEVVGIEPIYLHTRYEGFRGLCNIRMDFGGTADLLIAVPGIPVSTAVAVKLALGADHMAGEALPSKQWLFSVSAEKGWTKSILQSQQELALSLGLQMNSPYPVLNLLRTEDAWGRKAINHAFTKVPYPLIGVQCGAKEITKQWPVHSFGKALALLKSRFPELGVISFGSREEVASTAAARSVAGVIPWLDGVGKWTIRESLAILQRCDVLLSGDTGIMHMAASLGISTVSVFGPTSPERLAPLYAGGVFAKPTTSCHPCFRDKWTQCQCIELISPEEIVGLLERCLGSHDSSQVCSREHH
ncbi:MAG: hypothetical protein LZF60_240013 [Nitrospira sp.]|nr:MAG: hypothetical protein LZF60_240013 [Nitrospira sp.]